MENMDTATDMDTAMATAMDMAMVLSKNNYLKNINGKLGHRNIF